jgi:biopolymer transport protein ExbD
MDNNGKTPGDLQTPAEPPAKGFQTGASAPRKKFKKRPPSMAQPMLTPLIDVFLFLIIFFLLSCQIHQAEGTIPINLPPMGTAPPANPNEPPPPNAVQITLAQDGPNHVAITFEGREVHDSGDPNSDMEALAVELTKCYNSVEIKGQGLGEKVPILIKPIPASDNSTVAWGDVVNAFNQAVRAKFKSVGVTKSGVVVH